MNSRSWSPHRRWYRSPQTSLAMTYRPHTPAISSPRQTSKSHKTSLPPLPYRCFFFFFVVSYICTSACLWLVAAGALLHYFCLTLMWSFVSVQYFLCTHDSGTTVHEWTSLLLHSSPASLLLPSACLHRPVGDCTFLVPVVTVFVAVAVLFVCPEDLVFCCVVEVLRDEKTAQSPSHHVEDSDDLFSGCRRCCHYSPSCDQARELAARKCSFVSSCCTGPWLHCALPIIPPLL